MSSKALTNDRGNFKAARFIKNYKEAKEFAVNGKLAKTTPEQLSTLEPTLAQPFVRIDFQEIRLRKKEINKKEINPGSLPGTASGEKAEIDQIPKSFVFTNPLQIIQARALDEVVPALERAHEQSMQGRYLAGYIAYEAGYAFGGLKDKNGETFKKIISKIQEPLVWFGVFDAPVPDVALERGGYYLSPCIESQSRDEYVKNIEIIRHEIRQGNVYQVNYTIDKQYRFTGDSGALYNDLVQKQGSRYNCFINDGERTVLSISPELFFQKTKDRIIMKPMKGTRPRSEDPGRDELYKKELAEDAKERAENRMIVDLLRNDLGKICCVNTHRDKNSEDSPAKSSIQVFNALEIEAYPTVYQMTTTIEGVLKQGISLGKIFEALFPSGSVTGAPKRDAMHYIARLENKPRGVYTGAAGFIAPGGDCIFNVAIRTLSMNKGGATLGIGSGIVYDSVASREFDECHVKSRFTGELCSNMVFIESFRYERGKFRYIHDHLQRLENSAKEFGFLFSKARILEELGKKKAELDRCVITQRAGQNESIQNKICKIRLSLDHSGNIGIRHEFIDRQKTGRLVLAREPVKSGDLFLRHKSSRRELFDGALAKARAAGYYDAVFINEQGYVTQGCINNIFIKKAGQWKTPPVSAGLLSGIMRARLIKRLGAQVENITPEDLRSAGDILLCNSVRSLCRVTMLKI